jgi:hypothetical protein
MSFYRNSCDFYRQRKGTVFSQSRTPGIDEVARIGHIDRRTEAVVDTDAEKRSNSVADSRGVDPLSQPEVGFRQTYENPGRRFRDRKTCEFLILGCAALIGRLSGAEQSIGFAQSSDDPGARALVAH